MKNTWEETIYPMKVDRMIYEDLIDECVEHVSRNSSVNSVLRYGGVGMPGISDIDLIFTVDPLNPPDPGALRYRSKISEHQYCFVHGAGILPEDIVQDLSYLGFYDNLDIIHGATELAPKGSVSSKQLNFALMVDGLVDRLLALSKTLGHRTCKVRNVLLLTYSLKHTVTLCEELGVQIPEELKMYVRDVVAFREAWFENPDPTQLRVIAENGFNLFSVFTANLGQFAVDQGWWESECRDDQFQLTIGNDSILQFKALLDSEGELSVVTKRLKILHKRIEVARASIAIDSLLGPHFLSYNLIAGEDMKKLNWGSMEPCPQSGISPGYMEVMRNRIETVLTQTSFLKRHGFGTGCLHAAGVLKPSLAVHVGLRPRAIAAVESFLRAQLPDL